MPLNNLTIIINVDTAPVLSQLAAEPLQGRLRKHFKDMGSAKDQLRELGKIVKVEVVRPGQCEESATLPSVGLQVSVDEAAVAKMLTSL